MDEIKIKIKRKLLFFLVVTLILIPFISAAVWYKGALHVHTGFSTNNGYPGQEDSGCPWNLEGGPEGLINPTHGYTVNELAEESRDKGVYWNSYTDHSYCMNLSEFGLVKNDCNNADSQYSDFTCLVGEEVSAAEIVKDIETIPRGFVALGIIVYLNEIGVI